MINIIDDINNRIKAAEEARDAAISEVKKIKEMIAKNHIVFYEGRAYMFVGTGDYNGYNCPHCPFINWTNADSYKCSMHKDASRCASAGGRYYMISEIKNNFKMQLKSDEDIATLKYRLDEASRWLTEISAMSARYAVMAKEGGAE